jgi:hypothetical protein
MVLGVALTTNPHFAPRLKKGYRISLPLLWAFKIFRKENFTFTSIKRVLLANMQ